jgi:hypothetical protein
MLNAAAAIMIVIWPGHDIAPQGYATAAQCQETVDLLRKADRDLFEKPGFRAWCVADNPDAVS